MNPSEGRNAPERRITALQQRLRRIDRLIPSCETEEEYCWLMYTQQQVQKALNQLEEWKDETAVDAGAK